ncbi:Lsr2 family protein [Gryllotalpicola reticulitermitis]|uniref:Lsr2 family protein n=1 Tax=Gryllotalpicola reticulitermitis TaxID=1184153 RepID=A0ABV8Q166_9MICO
MKKVIEQLVDDLNGDVLTDGEGETVSFAIDGKSYEIDLGGSNAAALREALQPYIAAGRRSSALSSPARQAVSRIGKSSTSHWTAGYAVVREWAEANGIEVSPRGRVADSVMKAYEDAHN